MQKSFKLLANQHETRKQVLSTLQATHHIQRQDGEIIWNVDTIKTLRISKGLNQEQFASELGVRRETVSEWENSKYEPDRSKCKLLNRIAKQANFAEPSATKLHLDNQTDCVRFPNRESIDGCCETLLAGLRIAT